MLRRPGHLLLIAPLLASVILSSGCHCPGAAGELAGGRYSGIEVAVLNRFEYEHPAMGTLFRLVLYAPNKNHADAAAAVAFDRIDRLEEILSDYQADSELSLLRQQVPGTPTRVSHDLFEVLARAQVISKLSGGAFDVTAGAYSRLWRFSRKRHTLPSAEDLAQARATVGMDKLHLDPTARTVTMKVPGMRLDVGGIAKGYSADEALKVLREHGIDRALVAASGDIVAGNPPPGKAGWTVAVAGAAEHTPAGTKLLLVNSAVSTSGDTEQFIVVDGVRYSHILDPRTGLGLTNQIQATVVAPNATLSDALATTVCILGRARGLRFIESNRGTAALVIEQTDGNRVVSKSRRFSRHLSP